ncbi:MAG: Phenylalanine--tRNA ligase beta subunit [Pseudomonadales bacterium]|nr:Phenylalanine--tRNA ligase beta subunit [Pseudomonadales bacterium]
MKFSERWLREWVDPALSTGQLAAQLTMAGLEVDAVTPAAAALAGVVVGEVLAVAPHPDAERLSVCRVSDGTREHQVVCGARNVRPGLRVPFAREGAELPGLEIRRATLRGVESCGMLCAADELGIEARGEGLLELPADAPVGQDIVGYLDLADQLIELGLTPNRGDCLGIAGLAREVAALNGLATTPPALDPVPATIPDTLDVTLAAPAACPRYAGRVIRGVDVARPSPLWLQERLRRSGVRSIDAVVDVTNYVLLELGQPLHAFDRATLAGHVTVRLAGPGERLVLLDGSERELRPDMLVIADGQGAIALAGIMGGQRTAVGAGTRDIFLESAFFAPAALAGRARALGMHTDASHRFERGVDFELQKVAIERATRLLLDIVGGEAGPVVLATADEHLPAPAPIRLRAGRLDTLLGVTLAASEVEAILVRLGFGVTRDGADWLVRPTSYRFDVRIEADLIEEIARVHGYDRIPARLQGAAVALRPHPEAEHALSGWRRRLETLGYQEAITYSFVDPRTQALLDPDCTPVAVANPISADMAVMRSTLWAGLVKAVQFNQNRQQRNVRLFETGLRFLPGAAGLEQRLAIAGIACGERAPENWTDAAAALDFFDIKGDVESLLDIDATGAQFVFEAATHPALHPGQSVRLHRDGEALGWLGALHPEVLKALDLQGPVFVFELDHARACKKNLPSFKGLSKFPEVRRDLAVVLDDAVPAAQVLETAREVAGELLVNLRLFDVYRGQHIESGKKSMALGVVLQHRDRTLTDEEVNATMDRMLAALAARCGAVLR